jgi:hypothetical protein
MTSASWLTWLQRILVAVILTVAGVGLGYLGLVTVVPSLESSLHRLGRPPHLQDLVPEGWEDWGAAPLE